MRSKISPLILMSIFLLLTSFLYMDNMFKLTFQTNSNYGEFQIDYSFEGSGVSSVKARIIKKGRAMVRIYGDELKMLKIVSPAKIKISKIEIDGQKKTALDTKGKIRFNGLSLKAKKHFDFKIFLVMAFLFYALSDTLLNRKKLFDDKVPAIKNVEFLRLIFTFGVVVCHFAEKLEITTEGWLSVDFFFILSGFFLAVTFRPDRSTENFIKSKIIHFTPLLLLFALLSKPKIIPVLSNVFLLQSTGLSDEVVPVQSWYLAILFWGGLFYFYMMKSCSEKINKLVFGLLTFFLYCICRSCEWEGVFGRFLSIRLLRGVAGMGLGYFVALIYQKCRDGEQRNSFLFSAIESVLLFYCVGIVFFRPLCPDNRVVAIIAAALLILLFALRRGFVSRFLEKPFFAKISACSFSIYMAHWVFITDVFMHWYKRMSDLQEHKIAAIVVVAVLSYVLGLFVHLYIEKPSSAWLKKKLS